MIQHMKSNQCNIPLNRMDEKINTQFYRSIDSKKAFAKSNTFYNKNILKTRILKNFLNLIMTVYEHPTDDVIFSDERLKAFPLRSGKR